MAIIKITRKEEDRPRWGCGCIAFRSAYANLPRDLQALVKRASHVEVESMIVEGDKIVFVTVTRDKGEERRYSVVLDPAGTPQAGWCKHIQKCAETLILPVRLTG